MDFSSMTKKPAHLSNGRLYNADIWHSFGQGHGELSAQYRVIEQGGVQMEHVVQEGVGVMQAQ
jgi:hypothetical protein